MIENVKKPVKEHGIVVSESVSPNGTEHSMVVNSPEKDLSCVEMREQDCDTERDLGTDVGRAWEVCQEEAQLVDVQGRLSKCIAFWENELKAPPPVLECIREGYKLPLLDIPAMYHKCNAKSALDAKEFVTNSLKELLQNRCIRKVDTRPHVCSPLAVVTNGEGKKRLVLNLRYLNQFLLKERFKYEDLHIAMLLFKREDYLFTFDLKSGYHHVDVHEKHWTYLGFEWPGGTDTQYYVFTVLPFGLATAPYTFTKLLRPLVRYWRQQGIRVILYLDDGVVAVEHEVEAKKTSMLVQNDLIRAGFVINIAKSNLEPARRRTWLGFNIDLEKGCVSVPTAKVESLKLLIRQVASRKFVSARQLASVIGKIISMALAMGPVARLMTRNLYALLNTRTEGCCNLEITPAAREELNFWVKGIDNFNGQNIWHSPSAIRVVYSDASDMGYGGYMVEDGCHIAHGQWSGVEAKQSSTWRELRAVRLVLEALVKKIGERAGSMVHR